MPVRLEVLNPRSARIPARLGRLVAFLAVVGGIGAIEAAGFAYLYFARDLPEIPPYETIRFQTASRILSRHGMPLAEHFQQRRYLVPREAIPERLVQAVMASEDARFFEHRGLDLRGIARAIWTNLRAGAVREGASTLTQQVARSLLLGSERSLRRKIREAILARRIEDLYTKDQILTLYLNLIFLGQGAYGVGAAAQVYFGKPLDQLTLPEVAVLAALPQSPGRVNPVSDPEEMRRRRDRVLRRMAETGAITRQEEEEARQAPLVASRGRDLLGDRAPFPTQAAWEEIDPFLQSQKEGSLLEGSGGITAWISVDVGAQRVAEEAVRKGAVALARRQGWPGPLMHLPEASREAFRKRNRDWLAGQGIQGPSPPPGMAVLAMVTSVEADRATLDLGLPRGGRLTLGRIGWAAQYREFPREPDGSRREVPTVSLDRRTRNVADALHVGDVVLVRRLAPAARQIPTPTQPRKGKKGTVPAPEPSPAEADEALDDYDLDLFPVVQAALGALDHRTGEWIVEVGSTDWDASQVLRTESVRQSGSAVKPLYYAYAYDQGIAPSSVLPATPFREGDWVPEGGNKEESLTLWEALVRSENAVSARLFQVLLARHGVEALNTFLARLGIRHPLQGVPAEALGANLTLSEMIQAFATFARGGIRPEPHRLLRVVDGDGRTLLDRRSPLDPMVGVLDLVALAARPPEEEETRRALSVQGAWLIRENLREVASRGTGSRARVLKRPVAGKTGTLPFDVWFLGFTPEWAVGTWVGQDQRERWLGRSKAQGQVFGADTALPIFIDFLERATRGLPVVPFPEAPPGVVEVPVNPKTGELQPEGGVRMPHLEGTEPRPSLAPSNPDSVLDF